MSQQIKSDGEQLLNIPNTTEGQKFFRQFQKYRNRKYHITRRGRGPRTDGRGQQSHVNVDKAEWWALYINEISSLKFDVFYEQRNYREMREKYEATCQTLAELEIRHDKLQNDHNTLLNDNESMNESIILGTLALEEWEDSYNDLREQLQRYENVWWRRVARRFTNAIFYMATHKIVIRITHI